MAEDCEYISAENCDPAEPFSLPDDGEEFVDFGKVIQIDYRDHDGKPWHHPFDEPPRLMVSPQIGGKRILMIVGDIDVDDRGISG